MSKSLITTHILDTSLGLPAANVAVTLSVQLDQHWQELDTQQTDADGRILNWALKDAQLPFGLYRLRFDTEAYLGDTAFFPWVDICFQRRDERHHHIPLLLTAFGYSTYRGS
ncbi:hydroxyisourate hydrolase [Reinekea sp.]|jgi:5-hydroxyisourate hydrolase|uniref:hydroxyisourate hydrolase n=1 Tax=Reinekea sp. TaxID=1970455 RepID=UPI002A82D1D2|nr:hydroxyisourate hydrolase [Reinekea sp.]